MSWSPNSLASPNPTHYIYIYLNLSHSYSQISLSLSPLISPTLSLLDHSVLLSLSRSLWLLSLSWSISLFNVANRHHCCCLSHHLPQSLSLSHAAHYHHRHLPQRQHRHHLYPCKSGRWANYDLAPPLTHKGERGEKAIPSPRQGQERGGTKRFYKYGSYIKKLFFNSGSCTLFDYM